MCGIGLVIGPNQNIRYKFLDVIEKHQKNRGPDFSGQINFKDISMCHQRLSIVGLEDKFNQPYEYKNLTLIFNGEIYNFRTLAKEYNLSSNAFISDTSCLIELIHKIGLKRATKIIDGMYSFCAFDKSTRSINICVDDFGIKQLYYSKISDHLVIASTLKPLVEIRRKFNSVITIDKSTNIWQSSFQGLPPSHTHIEEIKQLNQNYIYTINLDNPLINKEEKSKFSSKKTNTNFSKKLEEAANSDVKSLLLLSGGVDSTALLCASKSFKESIKCITCEKPIVKDSGFYENESKIAKINARRLGFDIKSVKINKVNKRDLIDIFEIIDVPSEITGAIPLYFICKEISQTKNKIKYLISGLGADEIFFGYRGHSLSSLISIIPKFILNKPINFISKLSYINKNKGLKRRINFIKIVLDQKENDIEPTLFSFGSINNGSIKAWNSFYHKNIKKRNSFLLRGYYERCFDFFLAQCHLPASDRISMAFSFELRVPFLQKRILNENFTYNNFFLLLKSFKKKSNVIRFINKNLNFKYKRIPKSGFGTDSINSFSNDAIEYINMINKYGFNKGYIKEKREINQKSDERLIIHLINKAHYVYLLRKIF